MVNNRNPVSVEYNQWNDAQRVDKQDMDAEQDRNVQIDAAIVNNHFGSGVLAESVEQNVLFDSDVLTQEQQALVSSNDFDGTGIDLAQQPTDTSLGNQIEVDLTNADVSGRYSVKVVIIGLDFENNTQYDTFYFYKNEKQVTEKHYARIFTVLFNDFKGNNNCSRDQGGRVVIREAESYQLSRDPISASQDVEPNLFFRDFKISGLTTGPNITVDLYLTLQDAMGPEYTVDSLNIQTTVRQNRYLPAGDVNTKIGEKFQMVTDNIQKVTLLLGVSKDNSADIDQWFSWSGDLLISIYELQTSVSCPTSLIPELAIEFEPQAEPIVQLSLDEDDFRNQGYILTDVLQPVDFVFSDTEIGQANNTKIVPDKYYVVTISRSGAANTGELFTGVGGNYSDNSRLTLYNSSWVDDAEEEMWFQIWSDSGKVSDGQAYDDGNGIIVSKTEVNEEGAVVDYSYGDNNFANTGENVLNTGVVQAITSSFQEEQDERTGNQVFSRQQFTPSFSFVTKDTLDELKENTDPLIIGCAQDTNPKQNPLIEKVQSFPGLVKGDVFRVIRPDADLLSNTLLGSKLIPNSGCDVYSYKVSKVYLCTDGYGDVNGDGEINDLDVARALQLVGESLSLDSTQQKIVDGYIDTLEILRADVNGDGYVGADDAELIAQFVSRNINSFPVGTSFNHLEMVVQQSTGRFDGYHDCGDGYVRLNGPEGTPVPASSLSQTELDYYGYKEDPDMNVDPIFDTVPFESVPYRIEPLPWWKDYLLAFSSEARLVPAAFTYQDKSEITECDVIASEVCEDRENIIPTCDAGRNDIMIPANLIMKGGQILNPDGTNYKVDAEIHHIVLELPAIEFEQSVIDVFRKFVADSGDGKTSAGYSPAKFADCTTVKTDALAKEQLRFGVSVQSYYPNLDGYSSEDGYGIVVDPIIGVYMDTENGLLTLYMKDLDADPIYKSLITKIQISVHIKKAGWVNQTLTIPPEEVQGLLS